MINMWTPFTPVWTGALRSTGSTIMPDQRVSAPMVDRDRKSWTPLLAWNGPPTPSGRKPSPAAPCPACGDLRGAEGPSLLDASRRPSAGAVRDPQNPVSRPIGESATLRYPRATQTVQPSWTTPDMSEICIYPGGISSPERFDPDKGGPGPKVTPGRTSKTAGQTWTRYETQKGVQGGPPKGPKLGDLQTHTVRWDPHGPPAWTRCPAKTAGIPPYGMENVRFFS